jgi:hypothetical protein
MYAPTNLNGLPAPKSQKDSSWSPFEAWQAVIRFMSYRLFAWTR